MSPQISLTHTNSFYSSAPTSPTTSCSQQNPQNMCFYSVPPSPKGTLDDASPPSPTTPTMYEDANSNTSDRFLNLNDFEFETSRSFDAVDDEKNLQVQQEEPRKRQRKRHESLPAMAFADELFCDGKVMPLNPPPNRIGKDLPSPSSNPLSPVNPSSIFKLPFTRRNLWNDDFDPFMVALENVKEGKKQRRAMSMLPLPACTQWDPDEFVHDTCLHSNPIMIQSPTNRQTEPNGTPLLFPQHGSKSPIRLAEPKGVLFARRARMVKMDYKWPRKPTSIEPVVKDNIIGLSERPSCPSRGGGSKKWQKIMSFGYRNTYSNEQKQNLGFLKPKMLRKLSLRCSSNKKLMNCNEEKEASQMTKMTLVRYRPKLLLCMGYGKFAE